MEGGRWRVEGKGQGQGQGEGGSEGGGEGGAEGDAATRQGKTKRQDRVRVRVYHRRPGVLVLCADAFAGNLSVSGPSASQLHADCLYIR